MSESVPAWGGDPPRPPAVPVQPTHGQVPRRQFLAGLGAAAVAVPAGRSALSARPATAGPPPGPSPFPAFPAASTTTTEDREQMLWQLGITAPTLPPRAQDPSRPPNASPLDPAHTEGNWTDP